MVRSIVSFSGALLLSISLFTSAGLMRAQDSVSAATPLFRDVLQPSDDAAKEMAGNLVLISASPDSYAFPPSRNLSKGRGKDGTGTFRAP